jgi:hypothetical protein
VTLSVETYLRVLREIVESLAAHGLFQTIARAHGLTVTVCHYPPGASGILSSIDCSVLLAWSGPAIRSVLWQR